MCANVLSHVIGSFIYEACIGSIKFKTKTPSQVTLTFFTLSTGDVFDHSGTGTNAHKFAQVLNNDN